MFDNTLVEFDESMMYQIFKDEEKKLFNSIPHGSGINGMWIVSKRKGYFKCDCDFDAMNDAGYYDGQAEFSVIIPFKDPENFRLHFHGNHSQQLNQKHCLREAIEMTMFNWISDWPQVKKQKRIVLELVRADQDFGRKEI